MKALLALVLLGVVAAACGVVKVRVDPIGLDHSHKPGGDDPERQDRHTRQVQGGTGAEVPAPGDSVFGSSTSISKAGRTNPSSGGEIRLWHLRNGSINVSCTPPH